MSRAQTLVDILAAPEKALSSDSVIALHSWDPLLSADRARSLQGPGSCGFSMLSNIGSSFVQTFNLSLVQSPECPNEKSTAVLLLTLKDTHDTGVLHAMLEKRFGPSDPKCTDAKTAYWSLRPGYSLRWRLATDGIAEISLIGADPPDVNCSVSSVVGESPVDEAQLSALFARVKTSPPPWNDADAMAQWLSAYGPIERRDSSFGECQQSLAVASRQSALSGVPHLSAKADKSGCKPDAPPDRPPAIHIGTASTDMFAETKFRTALTGAFGAPVPACHNGLGDIWNISDNMIAALAPLGDQVMAMVVAMPLRDHECGEQ